MMEFLEIYGQAIAYGVFIVLLLALLCYMLIFRPKATCCSVSHKNHREDPGL